jgi:hypothetical protein
MAVRKPKSNNRPTSNMAKKKPVSRNRGMKPNLTMSDASGSNLNNFKNKAIDTVTGKIAKTFLGPLGNVLSNQTARTVAKEVSGINDVKRFAKDRSVSNAAMVGLSAASYIAPFVKPLYAVKAVNAANKAKALPVTQSALTKTLRLGKNQITGVREGILRGVGEVRSSTAPIKTAQVNLMGKDLAAKNFKLFETSKSIESVRAGRALAESQKVIQQGKKVDTILNTVVATNVARQTSRALESKNKSKTPKKK